MSEDIIEELRERHQEMAECDHDVVERDGDEWHCTECNRAFVEKDAGIEDRIPEITKNGCHVTVVVEDDRNRVSLVSSILEHIGLEFDRRYTNSGGTFSRWGLEKLDYYLSKQEADTV
ncbi:hypothetical protein HT576_09095 [Haloterrigena sp. SYSU A121-1]|uniref:Uncharacterized protein n=1 Tax=Haloterrigena gelatinilytica TaxID=2741724 RepID=A0A8J8GPI9_9EURY|nr:hypothetical protein [Haloterrigena gelatinilytica]NUB91175.1 hypothetical protein [Haloterrigena gelatinilytica]